MAIYTPSPAVKKTKIRYAGSTPPRGHPPAAGKTLVNKKPLVKPVRVTPTVKRTTVVDPLKKIYDQYKASILSEDEMQAKAKSWIDQQLNPNYDIVRQAAARQRTEAENRRQAYQAAYMAAANQNAGMAPQILAGFTSAAGTLGSLAAGATGQVGAATRADLASQGQALAAVGQENANLGDTTQQQGVENYYGGYLPAANISQMGAFAQGGFLGEIADERMRAVSIPWQAYQTEIGQLNETELSDLNDLATKRPEMVQSVLEQLRKNNEAATSGMLDVEKQRTANAKVQQALQKTIADRNFKARQAAADLKYKYYVARTSAKSKADKLAVDQWYKSQSAKIDAFNSETSRMNAQTSVARVGIAQQNADTSRIRATTTASGFKPLSEVMASVGRSRREVPRGQSRQKIANALYQQWYLSVPPAQRPLLRKQIIAWVNKLPLAQKHSSSSSSLFPSNPNK